MKIIKLLFMFTILSSIIFAGYGKRVQDLERANTNVQTNLTRTLLHITNSETDITTLLLHQTNFEAHATTLLLHQTNSETDITTLLLHQTNSETDITTLLLHQTNSEANITQLLLNGTNVSNQLSLVRVIKVDIGAWNMSNTGSVTVTHGLTLASIYSAQVFVISDTTNLLLPLASSLTNGTVNGSIISLGATTIVLDRTAAGSFSEVAGTYDQTNAGNDFNRGYVLFHLLLDL